MQTPFVLSTTVKVSTGIKGETRDGKITAVLHQPIGTHYYVDHGRVAYCYSPVGKSLVLVNTL